MSPVDRSAGGEGLPTSLAPASGAAQYSSDLEAQQLMDTQRRINMINRAASVGGQTVDPELAYQLAAQPIDDEELVNQTIASYSQSEMDRIIEDLRSRPEELWAADFNSLEGPMRKALSQHGWMPLVGTRAASADDGSNFELFGQDLGVATDIMGWGKERAEDAVGLVRDTAEATPLGAMASAGLRAMTIVGDVSQHAWRALEIEPGWQMLGAVTALPLTAGNSLGIFNASNNSADDQSQARDTLRDAQLRDEYEARLGQPVSDADWASASSALWRTEPDTHLADRESESRFRMDPDDEQWLVERGAELGALPEYGDDFWSRFEATDAGEDYVAPVDRVVALQDLEGDFGRLEVAMRLSAGESLADLVAARIPDRQSPEFAEAFDSLIRDIGTQGDHERLLEVTNDLAARRVSFGRTYARSLGLQPTMPGPTNDGFSMYNVVSGSLDLAVAIYLDPTLAAGKVAHGVQAVRYGIATLDEAGQAVRISRALNFIRNNADSIDNIDDLFMLNERAVNRLNPTALREAWDGLNSSNRWQQFVWRDRARIAHAQERSATVVSDMMGYFDEVVARNMAGETSTAGDLATSSLSGRFTRDYLSRLPSARQAIDHLRDIHFNDARVGVNNGGHGLRTADDVLDYFATTEGFTMLRNGEFARHTQRFTAIPRMSEHMLRGHGSRRIMRIGLDEMHDAVIRAETQPFRRTRELLARNDVLAETRLAPIRTPQAVIGDLNRVEYDEGLEWLASRLGRGVAMSPLFGTAAKYTERVINAAAWRVPFRHGLPLAGTDALDEAIGHIRMGNFGKIPLTSREMDESVVRFLLGATPADRLENFHTALQSAGFKGQHLAGLVDQAADEGVESVVRGLRDWEDVGSQAWDDLNTWGDRVLHGPDPINVVGRRNVMMGHFYRMFERSGMTEEANTRGRETVERFMEHMNGQRYSTGEHDVFWQGFTRGRVGILPVVDHSAAMGAPDFKQMLRATARGDALRQTWSVINNDFATSFMNEYWKPAMLMRIGFIPRAAGEEMLSYMVREGPIAWAYNQMALMAMRDPEQILAPLRIAKLPFMPSRAFRAARRATARKSYRHLRNMGDVTARAAEMELVSNMRDLESLAAKAAEMRSNVVRWYHGGDIEGSWQNRMRRRLISDGDRAPRGYVSPILRWDGTMKYSPELVVAQMGPGELLAHYVLGRMSSQIRGELARHIDDRMLTSAASVINGPGRRAMMDAGISNGGRARWFGAEELQVKTMDFSPVGMNQNPFATVQVRLRPTGEYGLMTLDDTYDVDMQQAMLTALQRQMGDPIYYDGAAPATVGHLAVSEQDRIIQMGQRLNLGTTQVNVLNGVDDTLRALIEEHLAVGKLDGLITRNVLDEEGKLTPWFLDQYEDLVTAARGRLVDGGSDSDQLTALLSLRQRVEFSRTGNLQWMPSGDLTPDDAARLVTMMTHRASTWEQRRAVMQLRTGMSRAKWVTPEVRDQVIAALDEEMALWDEGVAAIVGEGPENFRAALRTIGSKAERAQTDDALAYLDEWQRNEDVATALRQSGIAQREGTPLGNRPDGSMPVDLNLSDPYWYVTSTDEGEQVLQAQVDRLRAQVDETEDVAALQRRIDEIEIYIDALQQVRKMKVRLERFDPDELRARGYGALAEGDTSGNFGDEIPFATIGGEEVPGMRLAPGEIGQSQEALDGWRQRVQAAAADQAESIGARLDESGSNIIVPRAMVEDYLGRFSQAELDRLTQAGVLRIEETGNVDQVVDAIRASGVADEASAMADTGTETELIVSLLREHLQRLDLESMARPNISHQRLAVLAEQNRMAELSEEDQIIMRSLIAPEEETRVLDVTAGLGVAREDELAARAPAGPTPDPEAASMPEPQPTEDVMGAIIEGGGEGFTSGFPLPHIPIPQEAMDSAREVARIRRSQVSRDFPITAEQAMDQEQWDQIFTRLADELIPGWDNEVTNTSSWFRGRSDDIIPTQAVTLTSTGPEVALSVAEQIRLRVSAMPEELQDSLRLIMEGKHTLPPSMMHLNLREQLGQILEGRVEGGELTDFLRKVHNAENENIVFQLAEELWDLPPQTRYLLLHPEIKLWTGDPEDLLNVTTDAILRRSGLPDVERFARDYPHHYQTPEGARLAIPVGENMFRHFSVLGDEATIDALRPFIKKDVLDATTNQVVSTGLRERLIAQLGAERPLRQDEIRFINSMLDDLYDGDAVSVMVAGRRASNASPIVPLSGAATTNRDLAERVDRLLTDWMSAQVRQGGVEYQLPLHRIGYRDFRDPKRHGPWEDYESDVRFIDDEISSFNQLEYPPQPWEETLRAHEITGAAGRSSASPGDPRRMQAERQAKEFITNFSNDRGEILSHLVDLGQNGDLDIDVIRRSARENLPAAFVGEHFDVDNINFLKKLTRYGFDQVIEPAVESIIRQPMYLGAYHRAYTDLGVDMAKYHTIAGTDEVERWLQTRSDVHSLDELAMILRDHPPEMQLGGQTLMDAGSWRALQGRHADPELLRFYGDFRLVRETPHGDWEQVRRFVRRNDDYHGVGPDDDGLISRGTARPLDDGEFVALHVDDGGVTAAVNDARLMEQWHAVDSGADTALTALLDDMASRIGSTREDLIRTLRKQGDDRAVVQLVVERQMAEFRWNRMVDPSWGRPKAWRPGTETERQVEDAQAMLGFLAPYRDEFGASMSRAVDGLMADHDELTHLIRNRQMAGRDPLTEVEQAREAELAARIDQVSGELRGMMDNFSDDVIARVAVNEMGAPFRKLTGDGRAPFSTMVPTESAGYRELGRRGAAIRRGKDTLPQLDRLGVVDPAEMRMLADWFPKYMKLNDWVEKEAATAAVRDVLPYIDDSSIRSFAADYLNNLVPFYFAQEQFLRRWARTFKHTPEGVRKLQLTMQGLESSGFVSEDQYGEAYFTMPVPDAVSDMLAKTGVFNSFFGAGAAVPNVMELTGQVRFAMPGIGNPFELPGLGPLVGIPLTHLANRYPELEPLEEMLVGERGLDRTLPETLVPSWALQVFNAVAQTPDYEQQMYRTSIAAMAQMQSHGISLRMDAEEAYDAGRNEEGDALMAEARRFSLDSDASEREISQYNDEVEAYARRMLLTKGVLAFFSPASPQITDTASLRPEFTALLEAGLNPEEATGLFLAMYPEGLPFTVSGTEDMTMAQPPPTLATRQFMNDNSEWLAQFPLAGAWLLPQSDGSEEFDRRAWINMQRIGMRRSLSTEEWYDNLAFSSGAMAYFPRKEHYDAMLAELDPEAPGYTMERETIEMAWRTEAEQIKNMYPVFARDLERGSDRDRQGVFDELLLALRDPNTPDAPQIPALRTMMEGTVNYNEAMTDIEGLSSQVAEDRRAQYRESYLAWVQQVLAEHPETHVLWYSLLQPLSGLASAGMELDPATNEIDVPSLDNSNEGSLANVGMGD